MKGKLFLGQYLIGVLLLLGQLHGYKSCVQKERNALFDLKKSVISTTQEGLSVFVFPSWTNDTASDCCRWEGVKCNRTSGRVTEIAFGYLYFKESPLLNLSLLHPFEEVQTLNLSSSGFNGFFDGVEDYKSLRRLRNLEILDLSFSNFNNSSIFPFLNAATSLTKLFLQGNNMGGPFPAKELKDLTNLELLDLSWNEFHGFIPVQDHHILKTLRNLEHLDLSRNEFNNSIFPILNTATSLTTLFLSWNYMDGPFTVKELKDLTNLELLDLSRNRFDGSIPIQELSALSKLKALDLSNNELSGPMELQGICKLKNLQELDLSKNKFDGQFPLCLTSLTGLRVLDLSSNHLTGKLPSAIGNLEYLEYLSLIDNDFEGFFSFGSLTNLSKLKVFKLSSTSNSLQGVSESSWKPKFQLRVIALPSCNLEKVPRFLLGQKDLRHVDLSENSISENFPSWLLANNTELKALLLQNNFFTSFQLPESAHNLRYLNITDNKFSQLFPEDIGWILPRLQYMNISNNGFEGNLPSSLGNMKSLTCLDISHNRFQGKLPTSFVKGWYFLEILNLSHNKLTGEIFQESSNFTYIFMLFMDNNQFTGKIGQGLKSMRNLGLLDISNNNLTGVIPSWIAELPLNTLFISNNLLEGEIPSSMFNKFSVLDLSSNNLSGNIPPQVKKIPSMLFLQDNHLSGTIPDILLANVQVLDLRNNRFSGNIPQFFNPETITTLLLRGNNFTGRIPHQLCGLRNIQFLDLSKNRLSGSIPSCLSNTSFRLGKEDTVYSINNHESYESEAPFHVDTNVKSLLRFDPFSIDYTSGYQIRIDFVTKHRYDTYVGGNLELMFGLDLSENELSGEIPIEFGGLQELQALNLSHNNLSGVIPESFSGLKNVESLDLSFNILDGRIPQQLTDLKSLSVFNVSDNNLSGVIPQGKQFNTIDNTSYLGNPLLCGQPTNRSCSSNTSFQESDNGVEEDESQIDMLSFYWSFAAAYVTILVGIFVSLSFDSPWSRFWFYIVEAFIYKARNL